MGKIRRDKINTKLKNAPISEDSRKALLTFCENMHYIRKEYFKEEAGLNTKLLSVETGLTTDQLWRLDANLSGTIPMFLTLLYAYHKEGININELFVKSLKPDPGLMQLRQHLDEMDKLMNG